MAERSVALDRSSKHRLRMNIMHSARAGVGSRSTDPGVWFANSPFAARPNGKRPALTGNARLSFGAFLWPIRGLKSKKRAITRPMQLRLQKPLILLTQKGHSAATDQASSVLPLGGGAATRIAAPIRSTTG